MPNSTFVASLPLALLMLAPAQGQEVLTGEAAFGTIEDDAPGVRRHITQDSLPAPSHHENDPELPDFENAPNLVAAPGGTMPEVPKGFGSKSQTCSAPPSGAYVTLMETPSQTRVEILRAVSFIARRTARLNSARRLMSGSSK